MKSFFPSFAARNLASLGLHDEEDVAVDEVLRFFTRNMSEDLRRLRRRLIEPGISLFVCLFVCL
jgi:hypothetical protein